MGKRGSRNTESRYQGFRHKRRRVGKAQRGNGLLSAEKRPAPFRWPGQLYMKRAPTYDLMVQEIIGRVTSQKLGSFKHLHSILDGPVPSPILQALLVGIYQSH